MSRNLDRLTHSAWAVAAILSVLAAGAITGCGKPDDFQATEQATGTPDSAPLNPPVAAPTASRTAAPSPPPEPTTLPPASTPSVVPDSSASDNSVELAPVKTFTALGLEWSQFNLEQIDGLPLVDLTDPQLLPDGRVMAQASPTDKRIIVTENGEDWELLPLPSGVSPDHVEFWRKRWLISDEDQVFFSDDLGASWTKVPLPAGIGADQVDISDLVEISGDRWMVAGDDKAFFSDDQGANWTELHLTLPAGPVSELPGITRHSWISLILVSGQNMAALVQTLLLPDAASLVVSRGLVPERDSLQMAELDGEAVMFQRSGSNDVERFEMTEEELETIFDESGQVLTLVLVSEGGALLEPADFPWRNDPMEFGDTQLAWSSDDSFYVLRDTPDGPALVASQDGTSWKEIPVSDEALQDPTGNPALEDAFAEIADLGDQIGDWPISQHEGPFVIEESDCIGDLRPSVKTDEGILHVTAPEVGPSGVFAEATHEDEPNLCIRMAKGRYELRSVDTGVFHYRFALWDLDADVALYKFGPEVLSPQHEEMPDGIRLIVGDSPEPDVPTFDPDKPALEVSPGTDGAESYLLAFADPETGADLVTFSVEELRQALEYPFFSFNEPEIWVGWTTSGADWEWQTLADAFGQDYSYVDISLSEVVVGHGFVLVEVSYYPSISRIISRWFIARVG